MVSSGADQRSWRVRDGQWTATAVAVVVAVVGLSQVAAQAPNPGERCYFKTTPSGSLEDEALQRCGFGFDRGDPQLEQGIFLTRCCCPVLECAAGSRLVGSCVPDPIADARRNNESCRLWGGSCANGNLPEQHLRNRDDECGSCNDGFTLNVRENRCDECTTQCPRGYKIAGTCGDIGNPPRCVAYSGNCENGTPRNVFDRTADDQCGACNDNAYLTNISTCRLCSLFSCPEYLQVVNGDDCGNQQCVDWGGRCDNGQLASVTERRQQDHCGSCDDDFYLSDRVCLPCSEFRCASIWQEVSDGCGGATSPECVDRCPTVGQFFDNSTGSCRTCDSVDCTQGGALPYRYRGPLCGFDRDGCEDYSGNCINGELLPLSVRRQNDVCGTCNDGFSLANGVCESIATQASADDDAAGWIAFVVTFAVVLVASGIFAFFYLRRKRQDEAPDRAQNYPSNESSTDDGEPSTPSSGVCTSCIFSIKQLFKSKPASTPENLELRQVQSRQRGYVNVNPDDVPAGAARSYINIEMDTDLRNPHAKTWSQPGAATSNTNAYYSSMLPDFDKPGNQSTMSPPTKQNPGDLVYDSGFPGFDNDSGASRQASDSYAVVDTLKKKRKGSAPMNVHEVRYTTMVPDSMTSLHDKPQRDLGYTAVTPKVGRMKKGGKDRGAHTSLSYHAVEPSATSSSIVGAERRAQEQVQYTAVVPNQ